MKMKKENFYDMLHDTMSTLSGCLGLTEIVAQDLLKSEKQQENLMYLDMVTKGLKNLINNFGQAMTINHLEEGFKEIDKVKFDLFTFLKNISITFEAEFKSEFEKMNIQIIRRPLPGSNHFNVTADEFLLNRAISNLLRNAIEELITKDYPQQKRLININFGNIEQETVIEITNFSDLLESDLETIFEKRFSTKNGGSGRGTKIANAVAIAHGGSAFALKEEGVIKIGIKIPNH
jgi:signal transduction histidine kinase